MKKLPKTYSIQTFGCQMNYSDSERFVAYLQNKGMSEAPHWQKADLIVLNTCSVKQKAEDRIIGLVKNIRKLAKDKDVKVVLTGCMARRLWDDSSVAKTKNSFQKSSDIRQGELKKKLSGVDIVVETKNFASIGAELGFEENFDEKPEHYLSFRPKYKSSFQAYVPISTGCNHFCTFCIVPYARGKEVCRPAQDIIREVFDLIKSGYKDITLLGQTVNRWINPDFVHEFDYNEALTKIKGLNEVPLVDSQLKSWSNFFTAKLKDDESFDFDVEITQPRDFLQLLQVLDQIPGEWWTTWISSHPNYMTVELIDFVGDSVSNGWYSKDSIDGIQKNTSKYGHQRPYLHFALQSGSDNMLRKMNRRHTIKDFKKIVKYMKEKVPMLSLSTDIIVGFVKESVDDFQETLQVQEELEFDMIYISEYSPRKGTAAERLPDTVSTDIKQKRKEELNELLKKIAKKQNSRFAGKTLKVLIDSYDLKNKVLTGRTPQNKPIKIINSKDKGLISNFVDVLVTDYSEWSFKGEVIT